MMLPPLHEFDLIIENARRTLTPSDVPSNFWTRAKHQTHPVYNERIKRELEFIFDDFNRLNAQEKLARKNEFLEFVNEQKEILGMLTSEGSLKILN